MTYVYYKPLILWNDAGDTLKHVYLFEAKRRESVKMEIVKEKQQTRETVGEIITMNKNRDCTEYILLTTCYISFNHQDSP